MKKIPMPKKRMWRVIIVVSVVFLLGILALFACRKEMFSSKPTLTYYYLPSCGWCTKFNPEWEQFVKMAPDTIVTNKVDGSSSSPDIEKYKIKGFPHIQLVKDDGTVVVFEGDRTADKLMEFVKKYVDYRETFVDRQSSTTASGSTNVGTMGGGSIKRAEPPKEMCQKATITVCMPPPAM